MTGEKDKSKVIRQIDENLRRVYSQPEEDEIPDRFRSLLDQLKKNEGGETPRDQ